MKHIYKALFALLTVAFTFLMAEAAYAGGIGQDLCALNKDTNQKVYVGMIYTTIDANGNIHVKYVVDTGLNDNTYGTNIINWPRDHKFKDLVGSDKAGFQFKDKNGNVVLQFYLDYISEDKNYPSGYASLGVNGGDGKMEIGSSSSVLDYNSSLARNFNDYGYVLTDNSPATDINYSPNPSYPNWIFNMEYEVTVDKNAFGSVGFGSVAITDMHNSPSKIKIENPPTPCISSLGDFVWKDTNKDGIQDAGEPGIANVTVELYDCNTNALLATTTTDANGKYLFSPLTHGEYYVKFIAPNNYTISPQTQGSDNSVDSNPDATGQTACITLGIEEDNLTVDAGMYPTPVPPSGSLGDFVWEDLNHNGIQDAGEPGIENVIAQLYDCSTNNLLATTKTDADGKYLFSPLAEGSYYVKFTAPSGYTISPQAQGSDQALDSNPNPSGQTPCISLAAAEHNLTIDAGMYTVQNNQYPDLWINKDDGIVCAPDSGNTTTYTINFGNSGAASLYNAVVKDELPLGMEYVSSSTGSETYPGSNIVVFNVGTLNPNDQGSVTLTARVTKFYDSYLNTACISGEDIDKNIYKVCATDTDIKDTTSNSDHGGVESRGDLSELLLKRELNIKYGRTTPVLRKQGGATISANHNLAEFIPGSGPFNSTPVEATPFDILGISNATSSYAVNYALNLSAGSTRVGGIFSTITSAPKIYDHFKAVCDRLAGYDLSDIKLVDVNGYPFYAAKLSNTFKHTTDYAISFSVYETATGYSVQNKWTYEEYQAPSGASSVYNFQVWSSTYEGTINLAKKVLDKFQALNGLTYMNTLQKNPDIFISKAHYTLDGNIHLTITNKGAAKDVSFATYYRVSQGGSQLSAETSYYVNNGTTNLVINSGIISDANVYMSDNAGFNDEVYVSGGAYTYVNGPSSSVTKFNTADYPQQTITNYPSGAMVLSGGVSGEGQLKDWISVVRSLNAGNNSYDLSNFNAVRFDARGNGTAEVIINTSNISDYNYFSYKINLTSENKSYTINFDQFKQMYGGSVPFDASQIEFIGLMFTTDNNPGTSAINFDISNISFIGNSVTDIKNEAVLPHEFSLKQNYPNPFNPSTVIRFSVANTGKYILKVYNILGQEVATLVNSQLEPGNYNISFNAGKLASGLYIYSLSGNNNQITKKMILMK